MIKYEVVSVPMFYLDGKYAEDWYGISGINPYNSETGEYKQPKVYSTREEAQAECDRLNNEQEMEELSKKFHDGMHVRLRNGVEIKGVKTHHNGWWTAVGVNWDKNGQYLNASVYDRSYFDIVEVLSTPPKKLVKDVELKVGMKLLHPERARFSSPFVTVDCIHKDYVWLNGDGWIPLTMSKEDISDWEVLNHDS
jgi:hypothetical protein